MQPQVIKVDMLGGFTVWVNGELLIDDAAKLTKPWQLFCFLVLHREKFVASGRLIEALWADDDLNDPGNVLKNAIYSLRKDLCGGESDADSPIIYSTGGYRLDPAVKLELDVDNFLALCKQTAAMPENSEQQLLGYSKAVDAYKGDFLPQLEQELWVVPFALQYKQSYLECVANYCALLWNKKMYKELLSVATVANLIEPADEMITVYLFRALEALRMYRVIVTTCAKTSRFFADTLGVEAPEEVRKICAAASARINKAEQDIIVIKTEMAGTEQDDRPARGAYYCPYSHMKQTFPILKRSTERNKQALVLALFTLAPAKGDAIGSYDLTRAMAEFKVVVMNNLRKTDVLSRYSKNQYVMLLVVNSLQDGRIVRDRINEKFSSVAVSRKIALDVKMIEM
ncbi:hypothetical protein LJC61_01480 [Ruminococcaceae bacterium OttesenSCG-928-A16]|nr:hypothetical protein [Ruminococcaceae bacterium OttesenSCG-928-A16]